MILPRNILIATVASLAFSFLSFSGKAEKAPSAIFEAGENQWKRTPEWAIPFVTKAPKIDGNIDAAEWLAAADLGPMKSEVDGAADEFERKIWMSYDDRNVYLAFSIERPRDARSPNVPDRTGRVEASSGPTSDVVETMFAPALDFENAFSFWIYGNGAFGDATLHRNKKPGYDAEWQHAARVTDKGWVGEMAIPFAAFKREGPPSPEEWWGFDLVDNRRSPYRFLAHWSYRGKWHNYENFGRIRFARVPAVRFLNAGELGNGRIGVDFQIVNGTGQDVSLDVKTELLRRKDGEDGGPMSYFANIDTGVTQDPSQEFAKNATLTGMIAFAETFYVPVPDLPSGASDVVATSARPLSFGLAGKLSYGEYLARYEVRDRKGAILAAGASVFRNDPPLALRIEPYWLYAQLIDVFADLRKTGLAGTGTLKAEVLPAAGGGQPLKSASRTVTLATPQAKLHLPVEGLKPGSYKLRVSLADESGRSLATNEMNFVRPEFPEWYRNDLGNRVEVPRPWTPIKVDGTTVSMWGRTYDLSGVFPVSVTSRNQAVLAAPVALNTVTADGPVKWTVDSVTLKDKSDGKAIYDVAMSGGGLKLAGTMRVDFDGLIWYDLKLAPTAGPVAVKSMVLDVPVNPALCELMDRHTFLVDSILNKGKDPMPQLNGMSGLLQDSKMPFTPYLWVGSEKAGMGFVAEAPIDWSIGSTPFAVLETKAPSGKNPGQILANFIQDPKTIAKPMRLIFGLQASPMREAPQDRTVLNIYQKLGVFEDENVFKEIAGRGGKVVVFYYSWRGNSTTELGGTPEDPVDPEQRAKLKHGIELAHKYGLKVILYTGWGVNATSPNWKKYSYELGAYPIINKGWGAFEQSAGSNGGYADFMAWGHANIARKYGADGVLWDSAAQVPLDRNPNTGNAWIDDDGNVRPLYPVLATRDLFRRVYTIYHDEVGKDGIIYNHAGSMWPVNIYATMLNRGEGRPMTARTLRESWIPFEEFRTAYSAEPFGTLYSGEINDWAGLPMRVSTHSAVTLLHGTYAKEISLASPDRFRRYDYDTRPLMAYWDTFGWLPMNGTEKRFYYYDNLKGKYQAVRATPASLLSSAFVSGDRKRAVIVVSNLDTTPVPGAVIDLDLPSLGMPTQGTVKVIDGVTDKPVEVKEGKITLDIDQQRYRLLKVSVDS